jgi:hypothetical protein
MFRLVNNFKVVFFEEWASYPSLSLKDNFSVFTPSCKKPCSSKLGSTIRESSMQDMGLHLSWLNKIQAEEMVKLGSGVNTNKIVPFESWQ